MKKRTKHLAAERKNHIAWLYLVHLITLRAVRDTTVNKLHQEVCGVLPQDHPLQAQCWEFVQDVQDRAYLDADKDDELTRYRLPREERESYSYDVLVRIMVSHGFHISATTARKIGEVAKKIDVPKDDALAFARIFCRDMVDVALGYQ